MIADVYRPGSTLAHRLPAGAKLAGLALAGTLLFLIPSVWLSLGALVLSVAATAMTLGRRSAGRTLRASLPIVVLVAGFQLWFAGPMAALLFGSRLAALLLMAALAAATTRPSDIADAVERLVAPCLRPFGIDPARVGLAVSLAIRFVPVLASLASEIREAQAARGLDRSAIALAVPLVVRLFKMADEIAEAIDARS
ncbi:energy-coupling factor transporter transmembrane component T family protein [Aureimonas jatrophae]|uniref:Biotin transport system permease protein n=1 Tax=Aureimonas jatrophae TaxID=1166073 RepID=A0A1H0CY27_9HYPH|nr:energy-coupling factor transporter transmembrane protein EcfT [Aureimonas jatrophae]MBB3949408.1 biotin transport system permease protein [Aureimonas jatrophae]SDN62820.1 biotin transport system permease protein [Aureimonas jatrophae]